MNVGVKTDLEVIIVLLIYVLQLVAVDMDHALQLTSDLIHCYL